MSSSGIHISLGGLGGLGVVLLGLALASDHFGNGLLYFICLVLGVACVVSAIVLKVDAYYHFRDK